MKKVFTFILCASSLSGLFAQEQSADSLFQQEILSPYIRYFELPAAGIHTHFNKNRYMSGEGVWFKIYLLDVAGKRPFNLPQNVYAELFDPHGKLVDRQTLFAGNGTAAGVIELADTLVSGTYTFRAYTNWMRNTGKESFFSRTFHVDGSQPLEGSVRPAPGGQAPGAGEAQAEKPYDIRFFPEGGHLLAGLVNTIGLKILNPSGKGEALRGILRTGEGDTLMLLSVGELGMGSLPLEVRKGERYFADFIIPGRRDSVQSVPLPPAQENGLVLGAQWFYPDKVSILIRTNQETLPLVNGKRFFLLIHNRGRVAHFLTINWKDKPSLRLDIEKSGLLPGINHITLFDQHYNALADRMIFNKQPGQLASLTASAGAVGDTLRYSMEVRGADSRPLAADMSVSFLPEGSLSADMPSSIYSAMLLESDLGGQIERPSWYFEVEDFQRLQALDHLLLSQGWRQYDWESISRGAPPEPVHVFEQGFTLKGKVLNSISRKEMENSQVTIFSPDNGIMTLADVDSLGNFELPNLLLLDSSRVIVSASNVKGRSGFRELDATLTKPRFEKDPPPLPPSEEVDTESSLILPEGTELLEAVTVTGRREEEENPFAGSTYFSAINDRVVVITKDNYFLYNSVRDLLMKEFNFVGNSMGRGGGAPVLIVDDMPMDDLSWLDNMHISEVEAIAVNKNGNSMLGQRGAGGSINIKTRTSPVDWGPRENLSVQHLLVEGFSLPKAYYAPKYSANPEDPSFRQRAALYWEANALSDSTGKAEFKFAIPAGIKSFLVRTEGISPEGVLVVDQRTLRVDE